MSGAVSVEAFLAAGHEVVVLDDLSTGHRAAVPNGARLVVGDYGDRSATASLLAEEKIEAILHCAARSLVGESLVEPARYFRDNVGRRHLAARGRPGGRRRSVRPVLDRRRLRCRRTPPRSPRTRRSARSTRTARRSARSRVHSIGTRRAYGLRSVSLRYFNVAGATDAIGEDHDPETHLIPAILQRGRRGPAG